MRVVDYHHNNSGGFDWLDEDDWRALREAGWFFDGPYGRSVVKPFGSLEEAIAEFEEITGQDAYAEGCACCGPPHNFAEYEVRDDTWEAFVAGAIKYCDDWEMDQLLEKAAEQAAWDGFKGEFAAEYGVEAA